MMERIHTVLTMTNTVQSETKPEAEDLFTPEKMALRHLRPRGWTAEIGVLTGIITLRSPGVFPKWTLRILGNNLSLVNSDDPEPYEFESWEECKKEMYAFDALPWECPNCGEAGGNLVVVTWTEYQGVSPHGGLVDFEEQCCTKCQPHRRTA